MQVLYRVIDTANGPFGTNGNIWQGIIMELLALANYAPMLYSSAGTLIATKIYRKMGVAMLRNLLIK